MPVICKELVGAQHDLRFAGSILSRDYERKIWRTLLGGCDWSCVGRDKRVQMLVKKGTELKDNLPDEPNTTVALTAY